MKPGPIATGRLRLRALATRDLALFRDLYCDAEVMRFIGRPVLPKQAAASFCATLQAMRQLQGPWFFVVLDKRGGRAVGVCSIQPVAACERSVEIGIMLRRDARRRRFASEALSALMAAALRSLPIDTVWVQYRKANKGAARLFDALGFSETDGWRPRGARPRLCVRIVQRPALQSNQPQGGVPMSNIIGSNVIGFLENAGRNATLRHASREQLLQAMQREEIAPKLRSALLQPERMAIDGLLGVREKMYCQNQAINPPKKVPPPKKKPVTTPPKKTPAKKPEKKAPVKR